MSSASRASLYFSSSIGRKTLMGLTGLGWSFFLLVHMAANLLMLFSADAYNKYGNAITGNLPLLYTAEAGLLFFLLIHVGVALKLTWGNMRAKPAGYAVAPARNKSATLASRTLILSGLLILVFLISHLLTFKWGPVYTATVDGTEMRDLYQLVTEIFAKPGMVAWYVVALLVLGAHTSHTFAASLQSLGFFANNEPKMRKLSWAYTLIVVGGFIAQPIVMYITKG